MNEVLISAIICTHNRARYLDDALAGLAMQILEPKNFEVVVIDNASDDNTAQIVESWKGKITNCRYVYEPKLGLSYARNRGLQEANAPLVAYLDDDAVPDAKWLSELLRAYADIKPTPVGVGGRILPKWCGEQPAWLDHIALLEMLGLSDLGEKTIPVKHLTGANMSFQRDILLKYDGFDPRLGRRGNLQFTAEESDLQLRMRTDGHVLYYQPKALVWHQIDEFKLTPLYLLRRYYGHGQSAALRHVLSEKYSKFDIIKLIIRQFTRNANILVRFYKAFWLGKNPPSAERYWVRCKLFELIGFQFQMVKLFLNSVG